MDTYRTTTGNDPARNFALRHNSFDHDWHPPPLGVVGNSWPLHGMHESLRPQDVLRGSWVGAMCGGLVQFGQRGRAIPWHHRGFGSHLPLPVTTPAAYFIP